MLLFLQECKDHESPQTEVQHQESYLANFGLRRHNILGDGNCLFRAISYVFYGNDSFHEYLRSNAVQFISSHINDFSIFFTNSNDNGQSELSRLRDLGEWGGQECIVALARFLRVNILVTLFDGNIVSTIQHPVDSATTTIHLVFSRRGGGHYDAVIDAEPANSSSSPTDHHDYASIPQPSPSASSNISKMYCQSCCRYFSSIQAIGNHIKRFHSGVTQLDKRHIKCPVPSCHLLLSSVEYCMQHLQCHHGANILMSNHAFENKKAFTDFLKTEELKCNCIFVKKRGDEKRSKSPSTTYQLVCHRDGIPTCKVKSNVNKESCKATRSRNKKGSCKINGLCPARFYVHELFDGKVTVRYIHNHAHSLAFNQSKFLPIPNDIRNDISVKLALGVPVTKVLDSIRSMFTSRNDRDTIEERILPYHLIDRKSILNIKQSMKNGSYQHHEDNATSVYIKVQQLRSENYDPVLLYKPQGTFNESLSHALDNQDFILAVMTKQQSEIFNRFANVILCMNSTHKTNQHRYKLITLMVPDEFRHGYPVAFCICSKETSAVFTLFLQSVKDRCPNANVRIVMTDDDLAGFTAAKQVFGNDVERYLCIWHVHQSWLRQLRSIRDSNDKINVYSYLCAMLEAKSKNEYRRYHDKFISSYQNVYPDFISYFQSTYSKRPQEWCLGFRRHEYANVNTNMFVESFHNKLKSVYWDKKLNRRVDRLLDTLLQIERDIYVNHLSSNIYDSGNTGNSNNRHSSGLQIDDNCVNQVNEITFTVDSQSSSNQYTVKKINTVCKEQYCYVKCKNFPCIDLCYHMYTCTCIDFGYKKHICKHVHKVHTVCVKNHTVDTDDVDNDDVNDYNYIPCNVDDRHDPNHSRIVSEIRSILHNISEQLDDPLVQKHRLNVVKEALLSIKHGNVGVMKLSNKTVPQSVPPKDVFAPGALNPIQQRFKAISKIPGKKRNPRLKAPTEEQKRALLNQTPVIQPVIQPPGSAQHIHVNPPSTSKQTVTAPPSQVQRM